MSLPNLLDIKFRWLIQRISLNFSEQECTAWPFYSSMIKVHQLNSISFLPGVPKYARALLFTLYTTYYTNATCQPSEYYSMYSCHNFKHTVAHITYRVIQIKLHKRVFCFVDLCCTLSFLRLPRFLG